MFNWFMKLHLHILGAQITLKTCIKVESINTDVYIVNREKPMGAVNISGQRHNQMGINSFNRQSLTLFQNVFDDSYILFDHTQRVTHIWGNSDMTDVPFLIEVLKLGACIMRRFVINKFHLNPVSRKLTFHLFYDRNGLRV